MRIKIYVFIGIYLALLLTIVLLDFPGAVLVFIGIQLSLITFLIWQYIKRAALQHDGDYMLRRRSAKVHVWVVLMLLIHVAGYFLNGRFQVYPVIGWTSLIIVEVSIHVITRKLKPVSIVVKGNTLTLINLVHTNRDLTALKSISLDGFTNYIKLTFHNQRPLWIRRGEYDEADIDMLINICKSKSETVTLSANLAL